MKCKKIITNQEYVFGRFRLKHFLKGLLIFSVVMFLLVASALLMFRDTRPGVTITFHNKTDVAIDNLSVKFSSESTSTAVPRIAPGQKVKIRIVMSNENTEDGVYLHYRDANNEEHSECILGYLEGRDKFRVKVKLTHVHEDGFIEFTSWYSSAICSFFRI